MKYSEFERKIEALGLRTIVDDGYVEVLDEHDDTLLYVDTEHKFSMSADYTQFNKLNETTKERLFNLAVELASTPLKEREDEQKYYVKFIEDAYLVRYPNSSNFGMAIAKEVSLGVTKFTEKEIKDYDERYWAFAVPVEEVKEYE